MLDLLHFNLPFFKSFLGILVGLAELIRINNKFDIVLLCPSSQARSPLEEKLPIKVIR